MGLQAVDGLETSDYLKNTARKNIEGIITFLQGVRETTEFLELFLRNLLLKEHNKLKNRYTYIRWYAEKQDIRNGKQDIGNAKQDIQEKQQYIEVPNLVGKKQDSIFKFYSKDLGMSVFLDAPKL